MYVYVYVEAALSGRLCISPNPNIFELLLGFESESTDSHLRRAQT